MIRLNELILPLDYDEDALRKRVAKELKIRSENIRQIILHKRSIDARRKNKLHYLASVDVAVSGVSEKWLLRDFPERAATIVEPYNYTLPKCKPMEQTPVIVGSGPAGLFAALVLAEMGQKPLVVERGRDVDSRTADVQSFWKSGVLNTKSNVQFGEGGAGTFSDGKLTTGTKDKRSGYVLRTFAEAGAPEEILWQAKPHIGTDYLRSVVKNLRQRIIALGGEVRFETQLVDLKIKDRKICGAVLETNGSSITVDTDTVILAIGHSARDTFEMLRRNDVYMEPKAFSIGARIEHLQEQIDRQQYGAFAGSPYLKAADYKLAVHLPNRRGVYTFCMCPGGTVVAAASEENRLVTNGMSLFARDGINANSALLVSVAPSDFGSDDVLAGVEFQRKLETAAYVSGGGGYRAPVSRVDDFLNRRRCVSYGSVLPSYQPACTPANLDDCLPAFIANSMRQAIQRMGKLLNGFDDGDALLTAIESRSSSPICIMRGEDLSSVNTEGLYPCGEGAGYAGGIISAAVDGIRVAEAAAGCCT